MKYDKTTNKPIDAEARYFDKQIPQEIKDKIEAEAIEKYCSPYGNPNPETAAYVAGYIAGYSLWQDEGWVSVGEKPLVSFDENKYWTVNDGIPDEFFAAILVHNNKTGKDYWWMRHCIIKDETGLCVVTDDDEEPSGWDIQSVQYWRKLPSPPKQ
jgi:hypothetical protein